MAPARPLLLLLLLLLVPAAASVKNKKHAGRKDALRLRRDAARARVGLAWRADPEGGGYACPETVRDICIAEWSQQRDDSNGRPVLLDRERRACWNIQRYCVFDLDFKLVGRTLCGEAFPKGEEDQGKCPSDQFDLPTVDVQGITTCGAAYVANALAIARNLGEGTRETPCREALTPGFHFHTRGESAPALAFNAPPPIPPPPYPPINLGTSDMGFPRNLPHVSPPPAPPPDAQPPPPLLGLVCRETCVHKLRPVVRVLRECAPHSTRAADALRIVRRAYNEACGVNDVHPREDEPLDPRVDFGPGSDDDGTARAGTDSPPSPLAPAPPPARAPKRYNATTSRVHLAHPNGTKHAYFSHIRREKVRAASRADVLAFRKRDSAARRDQIRDEVMHRTAQPPPPAVPSEQGRFADRTDAGGRLGLQDGDVVHPSAPPPPPSPYPPPTPHGLISMITEEEDRDNDPMVRQVGRRGAYGSVDDDIRMKYKHQRERLP